jgi:hypothetical protein
MVIILFYIIYSITAKKKNVHSLSTYFWPEFSCFPGVAVAVHIFSEAEAGVWTSVDLQLKNLGFKQQSHGICGGNNGTQWNLNQ